MAKSKIPFQPKELLEKFAAMAKKSKSLDGDWQGDGWGFCTKQQDGTWKQYRSLSPVWEDPTLHEPHNSTTHLVIHARSASFPSQKGVEAYNQPFVEDNNLFVFNGLLQGVSFPTPIPGVIGSQKIWNLVKQHLSGGSLQEALEKTVQDLQKHTKHIQALNIGISDGKSFAVYNQYAQHPEYYGLQQYMSESLSFISSEPLEGYISNPIKPNTVEVL